MSINLHEQPKSTSEVLMLFKFPHFPKKKKKNISINLYIINSTMAANLGTFQAFQTFTIVSPKSFEILTALRQWCKINTGQWARSETIHNTHTQLLSLERN